MTDCWCHFVVRSLTALCRGSDILFQSNTHLESSSLGFARLRSILALSQTRQWKYQTTGVMYLSRFPNAHLKTTPCKDLGHLQLGYYVNISRKMAFMEDSDV